MDSIENLIATLLSNDGNYDSANIFIDFYLDNETIVSEELAKPILEVINELLCVDYIAEHTKEELFNLNKILLGCDE